MAPEVPGCRNARAPVRTVMIGRFAADRTPPARALANSCQTDSAIARDQISRLRKPALMMSITLTVNTTMMTMVAVSE